MSPRPVPPEGAPRRAAPSRQRHPRTRRSQSRDWVKLRRLAAVVASVAVVASTGVAWATLRDLTAGLTTSDALTGGSASKDGSVNILLMGLDSRKDQNGNDLPPAILDQLHAGDGSEGGYNTNTLILMHIPNNGGPVAAFSIPRDDYVPVRDIPGNDHVKIKEAYGLKKAATEDAMSKQGVTDQKTLETAGREAGRKETVQTVRDFLGVPIDHFAEVNLAGFYDMASALGGVQVCLNHPVNDSYSGADFPAGLQTLNGAQSLAFVRQRHGLANGDLDRTHRQQAFLASVTHKLASAGTFTNLGKVQNLLDVAKKDVVISAGWDISTFIRQATNLTGGNVQFATLPIVRYDTIDGQAVNIVDVPTVQHEVRVAFGLQAPTPAPTSSAARAVPATVDVLNGDGTPGLAAIVAHALVGGGLTEGTIGNTTQRSTAVSYGSGVQAQADAVAALLGAPTASADSTLPAGHISVVLGKGFTASPTLAQQAATLKTSTVPAVASTSSAPVPSAGPQGLPVDGGGIPCVD
jgi:LCP family protein required for cell wall assembly